jgi:hypothetical protein
MCTHKRTTKREAQGNAGPGLANFRFDPPIPDDRELILRECTTLLDQIPTSVLIAWLPVFARTAYRAEQIVAAVSEPPPPAIILKRLQRSVHENAMEETPTAG